MTLAQNIILVFGWLVSLTLTILHGTRLRIRGELSTNLFMLPLAFTMLLTPLMLRLILGDYPGRQTLTLIMFALVVAVLLHRLILLVRYLRSNSED